MRSNICNRLCLHPLMINFLSLSLIHDSHRCQLFRTSNTPFPPSAQQAVTAVSMYYIMVESRCCTQLAQFLSPPYIVETFMAATNRLCCNKATQLLLPPLREVRRPKICPEKWMSLIDCQIFIVECVCVCAHGCGSSGSRSS